MAALVAAAATRAVFASSQSSRRRRSAVRGAYPTRPNGRRVFCSFSSFTACQPDCAIAFCSGVVMCVLDNAARLFYGCADSRSKCSACGAVWSQLRTNRQFNPEPQPVFHIIWASRSAMAPPAEASAASRPRRFRHAWLPAPVPLGAGAPEHYFEGGGETSLVAIGIPNLEEHPP